MSDVHNDWKDYGQCNYTVCARMDPVSEGNNVTVGDGKKSYNEETAKAEPRVHRGII